MSLNHDLTTGLARDHQRQMLAEASRQRRYRAPRTPRTATQFIRDLAAAITSARAAAARASDAAPTRSPAAARPAISRLPATRPPADEAAGKPERVSDRGSPVADDAEGCGTGLPQHDVSVQR
jgi:hypothetical protein